ncbi:type II toxin-antitoxin system RelE/ParE family toxin [Candidatus Woesearchaeota archaeon]|nr:type II toxin-antitoxin system RelE/ParE family toxin [Candidatus Woesearchaeota archaeon]
MAFSVQLGPQPDKFIGKLDNQTRERIRNRLLKLQEDPFPSEVERVEGYKDEKVFRVRVGDYRILYVVRYEHNLILVSKVDKRGRVYN